MKSFPVILIIFLFSITLTAQIKTENSKITEDLEQKLNEYSHINSFIIAEKGKIIFEKYSNNCQPDSLNQICSVTKSITSLAFGVAIQKGLIKNIEQPVIDFFPEYNNEKLHPEFRQIKIKHLLTMSPGFNINDTPLFDIWLGHKNPIEFSFGFRPNSFPGTFLKYNDVAIHIISAIIRKVSGKTLGAFANENLFIPLEIKNYKWETDPQGNEWGNFRSWFYPRDLILFGQLVLNNGKWNGKQLVDVEFLKEATKTQISGQLFESTTNYGYLWYIGNYSGIKSINASGYGGQYIYIFPESEIIVVCTSDVDHHHVENYGLIPEFIIPFIQSKSN